VTITTVDGKVLYANQAVADQLGLPIEQVVTAEPGALVGRYDVRDEHGAPVSPDRMPGRVILREEVEEASLLVRNTDLQTGRLQWWVVKARRLHGHAQGLAVNLVEDLTAIKKAELGQRLLGDSGQILASSLDYERTLQEVANLAVPELADWCGVDMPGPHGQIRPVAIAHADPDKVRRPGAARGLPGRSRGTGRAGGGHARRAVVPRAARGRRRARRLRDRRAPPRAPELPEIEGWDIACLHEPAGEANDVGGDFFEVFAVAGGWMAVIGDVEGKGAAAASVTAVARHTIHAAAQLTGDALTAVRQLDRRLRGGPERQTCSVGLVQLRGPVAYAISAGHPPPLHVGGAGVGEIPAAGPLPGALPEPGDWPSARVALEPGESLVLYTDGVTDAIGADGERFGRDRLDAALAEPAGSAQELADRIAAALAEFGEGRPQGDDVACLVLRRR
jgi:hypothetical protein